MADELESYEIFYEEISTTDFLNNLNLDGTESQDPPSQGLDEDDLQRLTQDLAEDDPQPAPPNEDEDKE